uniref:Caspase family p20 domain-containing protein n=1 Tax=Oreochromis niloticus TaxID=8128 RepID=A0A669DQ58_ORENI
VNEWRNKKCHKVSKNIQATNVPRRTKRVALLINNMHFYDPALTRHGADKDEQGMVNLLHTLGYEVDRHRNLPAQKMDEALKSFARRPTLPLTDSVFVVVMSHGGMGTICGTGSHRIEIDRIYERLNSRNCPALKDKPKIVIIQASRGGESLLCCLFQCSYLEDRLSHLVSSAASSTDHCSYGSFFIQSIAEVFNTRSDAWSLCDISDPQVMQRFHVSGMQQLMPSVELHTLTKPFYLLPGECRNMRLCVRL